MTLDLPLRWTRHGHDVAHHDRLASRNLSL